MLLAETLLVSQHVKKPVKTSKLKSDPLQRTQVDAFPVSPLLFLVYIAEIPSISQKFIPTMFADDCTLSLKGTDIVDMVDI